MRVMEGELEHEDDLVVLIGELANEYDTLGWNFQLQTLYFPSFTSTYPADTDGANKGVINFQQEFDWQTRFWQYYNTFSDRRYDFVNFRDKQTSLACPALHNATVLKDAECTAIWNAIVFDLSPTVINWEKISYSHFETKSTVAYEACLADHVSMLQQYEACVQAAIPDYDGLPPWCVRVPVCGTVCLCVCVWMILYTRPSVWVKCGAVYGWRRFISVCVCVSAHACLCGGHVALSHSFTSHPCARVLSVLQSLPAMRLSCAPVPVIL